MKEIYLTEQEFSALLEYSTSMPTGTTAGKQWKRHVFTFNIKGKPYHAGFVPFGIRDYEDYWLMGEYGKAENNQVPITWRHIVLKTKETEIPNRVNALGL